MILDAGCHERPKAILHGMALGLIGSFVVYNTAAAIKRHQDSGRWERHLILNALLYTAISAVEAHHTICHLRKV